MNKKLAHTILFIGDISCFWGLWYGYHEFQRVFIESTNQADIIEFGNRVGFFIIGIILPIAHILSIIEHFNAELIRIHNKLLNYSAFIILFILLATGFIGSSWIKTQVENAGYIYCRNASGISALAKTLVYTKDMDICEKVAESKIKQK
jgi:hypothetical protein